MATAYFVFPHLTLEFFFSNTATDGGRVGLTLFGRPAKLGKFDILRNGCIKLCSFLLTD
jgi:hypothetical protein